MDVAVGRLHLSIKMAPPVTPTLTATTEVDAAALDAASLETTLRRNRLHSAVQSDRDRWLREHPLIGGKHF